MFVSDVKSQFQFIAENVDKLKRNIKKQKRHY